MNMKTEILGVSFDKITREEAKHKLLSFLKQKRPHTVYTANPEFVMAARKDKEFKKILNAGDLVLPDGIGIVYASRLNKVKLDERVGGYDLVQELFNEIKNKNITVYFFGSKPGVAQAAKEAMEKKHPGIKIIGVHDGYFNAEEEKLIIDEIKNLKPDILLVGFGVSKQEKWISQHKDELPCKILIGVGGSLDGMCGNVKRAPDIFCKLGLEWLYRLIRQPSRIKRQIQIPVFMFLVAKEKIARR